MHKRVLIMTGASDIQNPLKIEGDVSHYDLLNITTPSKERYARKHNYDFLCMRSFGGEETAFGFKDTQIGFLRAIRAFQNLQTYDIVVWLDSDAIITNEEMSLDQFPLQEDMAFYASYDWMGRGTFSTGNFILQKTNKINEFFNAFYGVSRQTNDEQHTLNVMYNQTEFRSIMSVLEWQYLNSVPEFVMGTDAWKGRQPIFYSWKEGDFLAHLTGIPNKNRIKILNENFKQYL